MRNRILNEDFFFSMTWDYLNVFVPSQHQDSKSTVKSYTDALTIFRRYVTDVCGLSIETFKFTDMTYDFLLDYRVHLVGKGYKPRTVNHRLATVVAYMKYAASRRVSLYQIYLNISSVPGVTVPKRIREIIEKSSTLKNLLSAPDSSPKGIRDMVIMVLLYDTAIRADELIMLNLSDVNISEENSYLRIHGKGNKERIVSVSEKTIPIIKQYVGIFHKDQRNQSTPFIYTVIKGEVGRMSEKNVERIIKKYADKIRKDNPDLPESVYPHMLRRTRATGLYRDGVPIETIALILGHSSTITTRKSYASPSVELLRKEMTTGTESEPDVKEEKPKWKDDKELAKLCGVR